MKTDPGQRLEMERLTESCTRREIPGRAKQRPHAAHLKARK